MSSVASASLPSAARVEPGAVFRLCTVAERRRSASWSSAPCSSWGRRTGGSRWSRFRSSSRTSCSRGSRIPRSFGARSSRSWRSSSRSRSAASSPGAATRRGRPRCTSGAAAVALGLALVVVAGAFRGEATPLASTRDYLTLTKPRIMTLLLLTGAAGMFVGAQGVPPLGLFAVTMLGLALACGGASALNHVLDRDIDVLMGSRTERRPVASGRVTPAQALEFGIVLSAALVRAPRLGGQRADRGARARREPLLRPRLHALAEAHDAAEHRHRRRCRGGAAARRLRGGDRIARAAGALALPHRVPLDAAALLGARADDQERVRGRRRADAAGRARRPRDRAPDRPLLDRDGRVHGRRRALARAAVHRSRRSCSGRCSSRSRCCSGATSRAPARRSSSTTRSSTSRCSSPRRRSTRCSSDGSGARTPEPPLRLGALPALLAALRRHVHRRGSLLQLD